MRPGDLKLYVVANVDVNLFSYCNNEAEFKNVLIDLNQNQIPMSGVDNITIKAYETLKDTINIERIVSKVSLDSIDLHQLSANGYANSTLKIDQVFLHNTNSKSTILYVGQEKKTGWKDGSVYDSSLGNYDANDYNPYKRHYFYGFEGTQRLVIGGYFKEDNRDAVYCYYPIDIDAKHNTHYKINAIIKTKGVNSPDDKLEKGILELSIKVVDWKEENLSPVFE